MWQRIERGLDGLADLEDAVSGATLRRLKSRVTAATAAPAIHTREADKTTTTTTNADGDDNDTQGSHREALLVGASNSNGEGGSAERRPSAQRRIDWNKIKSGSLAPSSSSSSPGTTATKRMIRANGGASAPPPPDGGGDGQHEEHEQRQFPPPEQQNAEQQQGFASPVDTRPGEREPLTPMPENGERPVGRDASPYDRRGGIPPGPPPPNQSSRSFAQRSGINLQSRRPPLVSDSALTVRSTTSSLRDDRYDDLQSSSSSSWTARLARALPPLPRIRIFKRGQGGYREYSAATMDMWSANDEEMVAVMHDLDPCITANLFITKLGMARSVDQVSKQNIFRRH